MPSVQQVIKQIKLLANDQIAQHSARFFKTGPGEYGEGDKFLGIRVPIIRQQVKKFRGLALSEILDILTNPYHEIRLFAVLLLVDLFERGDDSTQTCVYHAYLENTERLNNWDLVDSSAHKIVGAYLLNRSRDPLYVLAKSDLLWDKRIAMIACYHLIKKDDYKDTLMLSALFLNETHDLMHKAVGWMLREVGNRNFETENTFLREHYQKMPRTALRYALEKFPKDLKTAYMKGTI